VPRKRGRGHSSSDVAAAGDGLGKTPLRPTVATMPAPARFPKQSDDSCPTSSPLNSSAGARDRLLNTAGSPGYPNGGASKPGSVHSKSSAGSTASLTEVLRRGVAAQNRHLEPSLALLRSAVIIIFVLVGLMNVAAFPTNAVLFNQVLRSMSLVKQNGQRLVALQAAFSAAQELWLQAEGRMTFDWRADDGLRQRMLGQIATFDTLHRDLYLAVDGSLPEETALYTDVSSITLTDMVPGSYVSRTVYNSTTRTANLVNAGQEYSAKIKELYHTNRTNFRLDNPVVFWIADNAWLPLRNAFNVSTLLSDKHSDTQAQVVYASNTVVLGVSLCLLAGVALIAIIPAVTRVHKARAALLEVFLEVPLPIIRALRMKAWKAVLLAQRQEAGDDDPATAGPSDGQRYLDGSMPPGSDSEAFGLLVGPEGAEGEPGEELDDGSAQLTMAVNTYRNKLMMAARSAATGSGAGDVTGSANAAADRAANHGPTSPGHDHHDANSWGEDSPTHRGESSSGGCCSCCRRHRLRGAIEPAARLTGPGARGARRPKFRKYTRVTGTRGVTLLSLLAPLLLYVALYVGDFFWAQQTVEESLHAKSETLYSRELQFYVPQVIHAVRVMHSFCDASIVTDRIARVRRALSFMQTVQAGLAYGHEGYNLRPGLQRSNALFRLLMGDGCVENGGEYYDMPLCEGSSASAGSGGFQDGIVGRSGLQAAFDDYGQKLTGAINIREKQLSSGNCSVVDASSGMPGILAQYGERFLPPGYAAVADTLYNEGYAAINGYIAASAAVTVVSVLGLWGLFFLVYRPVMRRLDREIKDSRALLLLFPDEVSRSVPAVVTAGRDMLATASGGGGGLASGRSLGLL
jgi:hypothetical protein